MGVVMRELRDCPPSRVLIVYPCPDDELGIIVPAPPPGWHDEVRAALGDYLGCVASDALQDRGVDTAVEVLLTQDSDEAVQVLWLERDGSAEQTGALIAATVLVCQGAWPVGMRYAKRLADRSLLKTA